MDEIADWPIREALLAYVERMKDAAATAHRWDLLTWAVLAPHQKKPGKPPRLPRILRDENG